MLGQATSGGLEFHPNAKQLVGMTTETEDLLANIPQPSSEGLTPSEAQRKPFGWNWANIWVKPRADGISSSARKAIVAMPAAQRGEFVVEEWHTIRLKGAGGPQAESTAVLVDRGDRMQIDFDFGTAEVGIDKEGLLVFTRRDGSVARHDPGHKAVIVGDELEWVVFERVADVIDEKYRCAWSEGITLVGVDGHAELNFSLFLRDPETFDDLVETAGSDEAMDAFVIRLRHEVDEAVSRSLKAVAEEESSLPNLRVAVKARRMTRDHLCGSAISVAAHSTDV
jgi:hypothetical protein